MGDADSNTPQDRPDGYPYGEFDAHEWAKEFDRLFGGKPTPDVGTMLGWFANAIMTGYDEASRRMEPRESEPAA